MIAAVIGKSHETIACYWHLLRARMFDCALCLSDGMCAPADFRDPTGHVAARTKPAVVPRPPRVRGSIGVCGACMLRHGGSVCVHELDDVHR